MLRREGVHQFCLRLANIRQELVKLVDACLAVLLADAALPPRSQDIFAVLKLNFEGHLTYVYLRGLLSNFSDCWPDVAKDLA